MRSARRFAAAGLSILLPGAISGEVLWRGDFGTKDLSQWTGTLNPSTGSRQNIEVVESPGGEKRYAARIVIHPDDLFPNGHNRVELHYDGKRTAEGETTFFSWRFRLAANAQIHEDIAYWETKGPDYRQSMAFYVDPAGDGTRLGFRTNLPSAKEHWGSPITAAEWHRLAMKILWNKDAGEGRVSVWLDGKQVVADAVAQTKPNGADLFIQAGFHRDSSQAPVETIFLDSAIEGTALEDVLSPEPPKAGQRTLPNGAFISSPELRGRTMGNCGAGSAAGRPAVQVSRPEKAASPGCYFVTIPQPGIV